MKTVFVSGTAGSGKSLLTSKLQDYYSKNGAFAAILNLDPGVENMPYTCDVDVEITLIMYQLCNSMNLVQMVQWLWQMI